MKIRSFRKRAIFVAAVILAVLYAGNMQGQAPVIRKVYAGGTSAGGDFLYTLSQLQTALNEAINDPCGSKILLQEGQTFTGTFVMRQLAATATWDCMTIATGVDASGTVLADSVFPAAGVRMTNGERGTVSYRSVLAKLQPGTNNQPSIRTVWPAETGNGCTAAPCIASGYTLTRLEFVPKPAWFASALVHFGTNKSITDTDLPGNDTQDLLSEVPNFNTFTQNDIHGDPIIGQHQGMRYSGGSGRITLNSFADFKSLQETQAITAINWVGPLLVENNLIEGTGENFMTGGGDSKFQQTALVQASPAPTTTSVTVSHSTEYYQGQWVTVENAGVHYSVESDTLSGSVLTLKTALPFTPVVGAEVKWTRLGGGLTFRINDVWKRPEWRDPIMTPPTSVSVNCVNTGGSLAAGTYTYSVSNWRLMYGNAGGNINSAASAQDSDTVTSGTTGSCTVTWINGTAATAGSRVHGRAATATGYAAVAADVQIYTDTGASLTAGTAPSTGSIWVVKNNFELKHADGHAPAGVNLIEGNRFAYTWCCSQDMLINLKTWNQSGGDVSSRVSNLTYRYNLHIGGARWMNITATDAEFHPSGITENINVHDNLVVDVGPQWGGSRSAVQISQGSYTNRAAGSMHARNVVFNHNTILNAVNSNSALIFTMSAGNPTVDFQWKNNLIRNGDFGLRTYISDQGQTIGTVSWNAATSGTNRLATHNVWVGLGSPTSYPDTPNNWAPTDTAFQAEFTNYASCNAVISDPTPCTLIPTSTYNNAGNDGADVGANIASIKALTDLAIAGTGGGGGPAENDPPTVNAGNDAAITLPAGVTFNGTVGDDGLPDPPAAVTTTWTKVSGPGTVAFGNTAVIDTTATFSLAGTYVLRLTVTDGEETVWDEITITVNASSGLTISNSSILPPAIIRQTYTPVTLTGANGTAPYTFTRTLGTWPTGLSMNSAGQISGTCTAIGTRTVTIRVTDATAGQATKVFSITCRARRPAVSIGGNERFIFASELEPSPVNNRDVLYGDLWMDPITEIPKWCSTAVNWTCTQWQVFGTGGGGGASTLDDLTDVTITSPANGHVITYNGALSQWVNGPFTGIVQGGNALGVPIILGATDNQPINIIANNTVRLKTDASPSVNAVTLQANGNNNPEIYVTQGDASDWMNMGFNAADGRRVVGQAGQGTFRSYFGLAGATAGTNYIFGIASSANSGSTNTRWFGVRHDGMVAIKHLTLETGTRPTCAAAERGTFWYVAGAVGVKDTVEVCAKAADNTYAWRVIY